MNLASRLFSSTPRKLGIIQLDRHMLFTVLANPIKEVVRKPSFHSDVCLWDSSALSCDDSWES